MKRLKLGIIGGGPGSWIGHVHRIASRFDDKYEIVAGVFSRNYKINQSFGTSIGIKKNRCYKNYKHLCYSEKKIKDATGVFSSAGPIAVTRLEREKEMGIKSSESMEAEHPIVITVDGKKTLYISPGHLMKIKNVKEDEAEYLKNYLVDHVNKEEFIFSYEWTKGDICLWDNLSILHMASEIKNCRRVMHRITIK